VFVKLRSPIVQLPWLLRRPTIFSPREEIVREGVSHSLRATITVNFNEFDVFERNVEYLAALKERLASRYTFFRFGGLRGFPRRWSGVKCDLRGVNAWQRRESAGRRVENSV
jgi:hypothetical protein